MKFLKFLPFLFMCTLSFGQKLDLDRKKVNFRTIDLPDSTDLYDFNTYSVNIIASQITLNNLGLNPEKVSKMGELVGFTYQPEDAELVYSIYIEEPRTLKEDIITKTKETKNSDGTTKVVTTYHFVCNLTASTAIQIYCPFSGEFYTTEIFSTVENPTVFESVGYSTEADAKKWMNIRTKQGHNSEVLSLYIKNLNSYIEKVKKNYAYRYVDIEQTFYDANLDKDPSYKEFNDELEFVIKTIQDVKPNQHMLEAQVKATPILDKWLAAASKINSADKELKKVKFLYLYNLCVAQLHLELIQEGSKNCELLKEIDFKKGDISDVEVALYLEKKYFKKHGVNTRHVERPGFSSTSKFVYVPGPVEKKNMFKKMIDDNVKDYKDFKSSIVEIQDLYKRDIQSIVLGDSVAPFNGRFSTMKYTLDGDDKKYGKFGLKYGNGFNPIYKRENVYTISATPSNIKGMIRVEGSVLGVSIDFYSNKYTDSTTTPTILLDFLKNNPNSEVMDILTKSPFDTVQYVDINTRERTPLDQTSWAQYGKEFSAEIGISFFTYSRDDVYDYRTKNGEKFQIKILETKPILITRGEGVVTQGYVVKFVVPEVKIYELKYGHYRPCYTSNYKVLKNLEMSVILH